MNKKSMGEFIAALRKSKGYTQQDVADRLDVSNKAVSRWERDETAPDISIIPALAELLGVTCDELLRGEKSNGTTEVSERSEAKVDKQVKSLLGRTLSKFKTLSLIAIAIAIHGFIYMVGLEIILIIPGIGIIVLLLLEVAAVILEIIALNKVKNARINNDLFKKADVKDVEEFNAECIKYAKRTFQLMFVGNCVIVILAFLIGCVKAGYLDLYIAVFAIAIIATLIVVFDIGKRAINKMIMG